jgi:hypothetical protein
MKNQFSQSQNIFYTTSNTTQATGTTMVVPSVLCTVSTCSVLLDLNYIFTCTDFDEL